MKNYSTVDGLSKTILSDIHIKVHIVTYILNPYVAKMQTIIYLLLSEQTMFIFIFHIDVEIIIIIIIVI